MGSIISDPKAPAPIYTIAPENSMIGLGHVYIENEKHLENHLIELAKNINKTKSKNISGSFSFKCGKTVNFKVTVL